jgi:hypothetical protein
MRSVAAAASVSKRLLSVGALHSTSTPFRQLHHLVRNRHLENAPTYGGAGAAVLGSAHPFGGMQPARRMIATSATVSAAAASDRKKPSRRGLKRGKADGVVCVPFLLGVLSPHECASHLEAAFRVPVRTDVVYFGARMPPTALGVSHILPQ